MAEILLFYVDSDKIKKMLLSKTANQESITIVKLRKEKYLWQIQKGCKNGVKLKGVNSVVMDIMEQTGFASVLEVE